MYAEWVRTLWIIAQYRSIPIKIAVLIPMPINTDHRWLMPINSFNFDQCQNWWTLISNDRKCAVFRINQVLIGIGHWPRESWWVIDMQNITHRIQPTLNIVISLSSSEFLTWSWSCLKSKTYSKLKNFEASPKRLDFLLYQNKVG